MAANEIHVGDIGTTFEGTVYGVNSLGESYIVDISSATNLEIMFQKDDGSVVTKTAELTSDGSDGKMEYNIIEGDLDQVGDWKMQGRVHMTGGFRWSTDIFDFEVHANLDEIAAASGDVEDEGVHVWGEE